MNQIGKYKFRVDAQGFGEAETGTAFFFLEGEPVAFLQDGQEYDCEHNKRTIKVYISEKTIDRVRGDLEKLGFSGKFAQLDPGSPNHHSFVGSEIVVDCKHEPGTGQNSGKTYEKYELPYEGATIEHKSGVASKLDTLFGKKMGPASKPAPKRQAQPVGNGPGGKDDVPF